LVRWLLGRAEPSPFSSGFFFGVRCSASLPVQEVTLQWNEFAERPMRQTLSLRILRGIYFVAACALTKLSGNQKQRPLFSTCKHVSCIHTDESRTTNDLPARTTLQWWIPANGIASHHRFDESPFKNCRSSLCRQAYQVEVISAERPVSTNDAFAGDGPKPKQLKAIPKIVDRAIKPKYDISCAKRPRRL
jgi:hypothetical protein